MNPAWVVYILECSDGTLYTGCTNDLRQRIKTHNQGKGAKYTRGRTPVKLAYQESCKDRSQAQKREYELKQLTVEKKIELISNNRS